MPHYKDGTPAHVGDVVRGIGYNLKDGDRPREFVGTVVGVVPTSATCNIQVAHIKTVQLRTDAYQKYRVEECLFWQQRGVIGCGEAGGLDGTPNVGAVVELEYGECASFELILPVMREILCEAKPKRVRPTVSGVELKRLCDATLTCQLFRRSACDSGDTAIGDNETVTVNDGDKFYCVPPATSKG